MAENERIVGWKAHTEYVAEYTHRGSTWALNFFAVDDEDAAAKLASLRASASLLGRLEGHIDVDLQ